MKKSLNYLYEAYSQNRIPILLYLGLCIFLCVFSGPFAEPFSEAGKAFATEGTVSTGDTISQLISLFTAGTFTALAGSYSSIVGVSVEPFAALLFIGLMENINKWCGSPLNMYPSPVGHPVVLIIVAIFFVASKIMKANEGTKVIGSITLGEIEEKLGLVFALVLGISNIVGITNVALGGTPVNAADGNPVSGSSVIVAVISASYAVIMTIISLVVYFVIKTVARGIDIIQATVTTFIPGSGLIFEIVKTVIVDVLIFVNIICPPVGIAINLIIFLICLVLFWYFYPVVKYFNAIYVKPFWKRLGHFNEFMPLMVKKMPKKVRKFLKEDADKVDMMIPVYVLRFKDKQEIKTKHYRKLWLIHKDDGMFVIKKAGRVKKMQMAKLENRPEDKVYLQKHFRYFEIFAYWPSEENLAKKRPIKRTSLVFSREYLYKHEEILEITGFEDFNAIITEQKLTRKQLREERKAQRALERKLYEEGSALLLEEWEEDK